jgi:tetratricopeptide (TPR) repeat protein
MDPTIDADTLAAAVADGTPIDWEGLAARAATPDQRTRLARFALIARVCGVHANASPTVSVSSTPDAAPDYRTGDHWGSLRIVERLAAGTFGTVYRAHDPALARDVALKILSLPGSADGAALEAVREGRLLARVRHPGVVTVYGADQRDGRVGLWMELVEGRTLEDEVEARGPLPVHEVLAIGAVVAQALHAVHAAGLLHRDLKTQNVMRDARDGRVVLMDFSAGREQVDTVQGTWPATIVGSPLYIAPELLGGAQASAQTDVYGLGVILFRLLTARFPVEGATLAEVEQAHRRGHSLSLEHARPDAPTRVSRIVTRALHPDPTQRYGSVAALESDLRTARDTTRGWSRRVVGIAAMVVLVCALVGGWATSYLARSTTPPNEFAARDWVLIADFENRTGDASFDDVLEQALTRELTSSRHVNVVPRARVEDALTLMQQSPDGPLDIRRAREVSLRDGNIRAVLSGRIARVGAAYVLTTEILDPSDGRIHAVVEVDVAKQSALLSAVREQAFRVRETLGESLPALERSRQELARVTTPSLEALQLYSRAAALLEGETWLARDDVVSRYESADALLAQAIAVDPAFASAWLLRARAAAARDWPVKPYAPRANDEQLAYAERALLLVEQVSSEERYFIEGVAARIRADLGAGRRPDLIRAARAFETLLQLVPDHYWALIELEPIYRRLQRIDDAERTALHGASLRPNSIRLAAAAARVHMRRRDRGALQRVATRALANVPPDLDRVAGALSHDLADLRTWEARDAWLDTDVTRLAALLERYEQHPQMPSSAAFRGTMNMAWTGMGRFERAHRLIERHSPQPVAAFRHNMVDRYREAWDVLRPRLLAERNNFAYVDMNAFFYLWVGLADVGEWLVRERGRRGVQMNWEMQQEFTAQMRVAQGRYAEALELFEPILQDDLFPRLRMHELVAIARHETGDRRGAITLLERFDADPLSAVGSGWNAHDWLGCELRLAEYHLEAGRSADAARVAAKVRAHLVLADPGHPFRERLARLP